MNFETVFGCFCFGSAEVAIQHNFGTGMFRLEGEAAKTLSCNSPRLEWWSFTAYKIWIRYVNCRACIHYNQYMFIQLRNMFDSSLTDMFNVLCFYSNSIANRLQVTSLRPNQTESRSRCQWSWGVEIPGFLKDRTCPPPALLYGRASHRYFLYNKVPYRKGRFFRTCFKQMEFR